MPDFDVCPAGTRDFVDAILKATPKGEAVLVQLAADGSWKVFGDGIFAQPCHKHEYVMVACADCGKAPGPTAERHA